MRKRWRWPILDVLRDAEVDDWAAACLVWLVAGFIVLIIPAMIVDTDRYGNMHLGTYLLVALIVYGAPLTAALLLLAGRFAWFLLDEYGAELIPRRVTEPVREDLRVRERGGDG